MLVDKDLVEKAKSGDKKSFEVIYASIYKDMYRYAYYMLGNREDAADVVSETVLDAYKGLRCLKDTNAFASWILKILSNKCKMKRKQYIDKTEEYIENYNDKNMCTNGVADTEKVFDETSYQKIDLQRALNDLSVEDREIVILSVVYEYNSNKIGQYLHMNSSTIRSKLNRALRKVRERMVAYDK